MGKRSIPTDAPDEPADGRSCDAGNCDDPSTGWRWFTDLREWLPACERHISKSGVPDRFRAYDPPFPPSPSPERTDR